MVKLEFCYTERCMRFDGEMQVLEGLDAVLDVGGVYDPRRDRYDHHQKGFEEEFGHGFTTKLSSAGLVYKVILSAKERGAGEISLHCGSYMIL